MFILVPLSTFLSTSNLPPKNDILDFIFLKPIPPSFDLLDKLLLNGVVTRRGNPVWSVGSIQNVLTEIPHYQGYWSYHDKKSGEDIRVDCPTVNQR